MCVGLEILGNRVLFVFKMFLVRWGVGYGRSNDFFGGGEYLNVVFRLKVLIFEELGKVFWRRW